MTRRIDDPKRMTHQGGLANEPINTQTEFKILREREIRLNMKNGRKVISATNKNYFYENIKILSIKASGSTG